VANIAETSLGAGFNPIGHETKREGHDLRVSTIHEARIIPLAQRAHV
jgi:hypothetical protein